MDTVDNHNILSMCKNITIKYSVVYINTIIY